MRSDCFGLVGMKRRQIRAMIRSEAVILALFGAVIGIVVGTGLGAALSHSLEKSQEITVVSIPFPSLVLFVVVAAFLGLSRSELASTAGGQARRSCGHRCGVSRLGMGHVLVNRWPDRVVFLGAGHRSRQCVTAHSGLRRIVTYEKLVRATEVEG